MKDIAEFNFEESKGKFLSLLNERIPGEQDEHGIAEQIIEALIESGLDNHKMTREIIGVAYGDIFTEGNDEKNELPKP